MTFLGIETVQQNQKMGHGTVRACDRFRKEKRYQVIGAGLFCCRLDRALKLH
jgi:hypothetical protein